MEKKEQTLRVANEMRRMWATGDAARDEGLLEPEEVRKIRDISYRDSETEEEKKWHLTDIYFPKEENDCYPVIISIHGGGWFYGDKQLYRFYAMHLAKKGFAVVNFNYRLSPEYQYPSGFSDVCHLMDFLVNHAKEYQLDLEHVYMVGDSAGAQLVSQYQIFVTSEEYRRLFSFADSVKLLRANKVALNCGIYDMRERLKNDKQLCKWYLPEQMDKTLSDSFEKVLDYMNADFPATYLMCSVNDGLMVHTAAMKEKLEVLGITHLYREFGQDNQADGHVFHINLKSENGQKCNQEEVDFFLD